MHDMDSFSGPFGVCTNGFRLFCFSVPEYLPVCLGATLGKVTTGSHTTAGFKEDKRNKATPGKRQLQIPIPFPVLHVSNMSCLHSQSVCPFYLDNFTLVFSAEIFLSI